jgi:hypothetical protein
MPVCFSLDITSLLPACHARRIGVGHLVGLGPAPAFCGCGTVPSWWLVETQRPGAGLRYGLCKMEPCDGLANRMPVTKWMQWSKNECIHYNMSQGIDQRGRREVRKTGPSLGCPPAASKILTPGSIFPRPRYGR